MGSKCFQATEKVCQHILWQNLTHEKCRYFFCTLKSSGPYRALKFLCFDCFATIFVRLSWLEKNIMWTADMDLVKNFHFRAKYANMKWTRIIFAHLAACFILQSKARNFRTYSVWQKFLKCCHFIKNYDSFESCAFSAGNVFFQK